MDHEALPAQDAAPLPSGPLDLLEAARLAPLPMALCALDRPGFPFVFVNDAFLALTGLAWGDLYGRGWDALGQEGIVLAAGTVRDAVLRRGDGRLLACRLHAGAVSGARLLFVQAVEQPASEGAPDTLLRDFQHRVMNHLQFIQSVVHMQSLRVDSEPTRDALRDLGARVDTLAVVYRQLYATRTDGRIELAGYLGQLVSNLSAFYDREGRVALMVEAPDTVLLLPVERAFPLGLIVTELVVNSFKHAFRDRPGGTIRIVLSRPDAGPALVAVQDDGPGVPDGGGAGAGKRLGLTLIRSLAAQIGGSIATEPGKGARFTITVPHTE